MQKDSSLLFSKKAISYISLTARFSLAAFCFIFIIASLHAGAGLTFGCSVSPTCAYPSIPAFYIQNETGGYDNAHSQNASINLQGLVGWYRLDNSSSIGENASNVFDWSGLGNNGTPVGGANFTSSGYLRGAYNLNGINGYINISKSSSFNSINLTTFSVWINPSVSINNTGINGNDVSFVRKQSSGQGYIIEVYGSTSTNKQVSFWTNYPAGASAFYNFSANTWYNIAGTWNGTVASLYINGQPVSNSSDTSSGANSQDVHASGYGGGTGIPNSRFFSGMMDEIMIFNRSLSFSEVNALYNKNYATYNYAVCCSSSASLSNSCSQTPVLNLYNYTNSHAQIGTYSGPGSIYNYSACLAANPGRVVCSYSSGSCSAGYSCLGSLDSSETGDSNITNAHFFSCNRNENICCKIDTPPAIQNAVLNSTFGTNLSSENLTVYFNESDVDGDPYTNITDWRISGNSIAVLNMPLNSNISDTTAGAIKDYSTYSSNGTLVGGVAWNQSGKVGGGYVFDGITGYIISSNYSYLPVGSASRTITGWIKTNGAINSRLSYFGYGGTGTGTSFDLESGVSNDGRVYLVQYGTSDLAGTKVVGDGNWHYIAATYNGSVSSIYVDGILDVSAVKTINTTGVSSYPMVIGRQSYPDVANYHYANGTIDEVSLFNRSLSAQEVNEIYLAGASNNSLQRMVSQELARGQNWSVAITGNDYIAGDGQTVLTNSLIINNSLPTVTLNAPADNTITTNRTSIFDWTGFDADGDPLTYTLNLTAVLIGGTSTCSDIRIISTGSNNYSIPASDLKCLSDNNMAYKWSVNANDGISDGPWSDTRTLNVSSLLIISLPTSGISFGNMIINQANDTTTGSPPPITVQNDGNSFFNVNISAEPLWSSVPAPNAYYRFRISNNTGEAGAFNWTGSVTSSTNMPVANISAISQLNYSDATDSARADVYVQVPPSEPPAFRNSTITFTAILSET